MTCSKSFNFLGSQLMHFGEKSIFFLLWFCMRLKWYSLMVCINFATTACSYCCPSNLCAGPTCVWLHLSDRATAKNVTMGSQGEYRLSSSLQGILRQLRESIPHLLNLINYFFFSLWIYLASKLTEIKSPRCVSLCPVTAG